MSLRLPPSFIGGMPSSSEPMIPRSQLHGGDEGTSEEMLQCMCGMYLLSEEEASLQVEKKSAVEVVIIIVTSQEVKGCSINAPLDDYALADRKGQRLASVVAAVKHCATACQPSCACTKWSDQSKGQEKSEERQR